MRHYLDLLTGLFMVWQLHPWYQNLRKGERLGLEVESDEIWERVTAYKGG